MARKRLGELLLERGIITAKQLEDGLSAHRQTRQRLGVTLIQQGVLSEGQLAQALADALNIPLVDLSSAQVEWSAVHMLRARVCEQHDLFPFALDTSKGRKQLVIAMSDPLNVPALEEIEFTTGLKVMPRLAPLSQVRSAILRYYHKVNPEDVSGPLTVVHRGGATVTEEEDVIEGEEVAEPPKEKTDRAALADLIKRREEQRAQKKARAPKKTGALSDDLDYLLGSAPEETDEIERLERKFWALMRIMARKGLITKDEFQKELDEGD